MFELKLLAKHIVELRSRLLRCFALLAIAALALMPFANHLYPIVARPLLNLLPVHSSLIAVALPTVFFIPLKFALFIALLLCLPFFLRELWLFVLPALYRHEKYWLWLLSFSIALFYLGMLFAYFVVLPLLISFFLQTTPAHVQIMPDISNYYDLMLQLLLAFGVAFQAPVIMITIVLTHIVSLKALTKFRRYFIVLAFILGMLLTPPDVVSQSLFAIPLCLLFEIGLLLAKIFQKKTILSLNKLAQ